MALTNVQKVALARQFFNDLSLRPCRFFISGTCEDRTPAERDARVLLLFNAGAIGSQMPAFNRCGPCVGRRAVVEFDAP